MVLAETFVRDKWEFMRMRLLAGDSGVGGLIFCLDKSGAHFSGLIVAYKKDGCAGDLGWCFKDAVNNCLPATFYSYGQPQATNPAKSESALFAKMQPPSVADILASAQKHPGTPNGVSDDFAPASKTYAADDWASSATTASAGFRRNVSPDPLTPFVDRDSYGGMDMTPAQRSIAKGYLDGFLTAKIFASSNTSKLGFKGQYIEDSICALGPTVVAPGTEGLYRLWFMSGLQDGETIIKATLNPS